MFFQWKIADFSGGGGGKSDGDSDSDGDGDFDVDVSAVDLIVDQTCKVLFRTLLNLQDYRCTLHYVYVIRNIMKMLMG